MKGDLIEQFLDSASIQAMTNLVTSNDEKSTLVAATNIAGSLGDSDGFAKIADSKTDAEQKLISSFHNNLVLLIQKTWVEKSDEELKAQVLYHLEEFCKQLNARSYTASYAPFFSIVDDVVYLMFGTQAKSKDFDEYALRIDPEFGIFWWYMQSLPREARWSESKSRLAILLGMYFLANY